MLVSTSCFWACYIRNFPIFLNIPYSLIQSQMIKHMTSEKQINWKAFKYYWKISMLDICGLFHGPNQKIYINLSSAYPCQTDRNFLLFYRWGNKGQKMEYIGQYKKKVAKIEFTFRFELLVNVLSNTSTFPLKAYFNERKRVNKWRGQEMKIT